MPGFLMVGFDSDCKGPFNSWCFVMIGHVTRPPLIKKKPKKNPGEKKRARRATSPVFFLSQRKDECILFCQSWETGDIQIDAKDEKCPFLKEEEENTVEKCYIYIDDWQKSDLECSGDWLVLSRACWISVPQHPQFGFWFGFCNIITWTWNKLNGDYQSKQIT